MSLRASILLAMSLLAAASYWGGCTTAPHTRALASNFGSRGTKRLSPEALVFASFFLAPNMQHRYRLVPSLEFPGAYRVAEYDGPLGWEEELSYEEILAADQAVLQRMVKQKRISQETADYYAQEGADTPFWQTSQFFRAYTTDGELVSSIKLVKGWDMGDAVELPFQKNKDIGDEIRKMFEARPRKKYAFEFSRGMNDPSVSKDVLRAEFCLAVLEAASELPPGVSLDDVDVYGHAIDKTVVEKVWTSGPEKESGYPFREVEGLNLPGEHKLLRTTLREFIDGLRPHETLADFAALRRAFDIESPSKVVELTEQLYQWDGWSWQDWRLADETGTMGGKIEIHGELFDHSPMGQLQLKRLARKNGASYKGMLKILGIRKDEPLLIRLYKPLNEVSVENHRQTVRNYVARLRERAKKEGYLDEFERAFRKTRVVLYETSPDAFRRKAFRSREFRLGDFVGTGRVGLGRVTRMIPAQHRRETRYPSGALLLRHSPKIR